MARKKSKRFFEDLKESLEAVVAYERGERNDLRVTYVPSRPKKLSAAQIRAVRKSLKASQVTFARMLNVSANTIESWEQGVRKPQAAALKLLHIAKEHPEVLLKVS